MTAARHYVILDKNFLQKENLETPRLRALAMAGCELVLIDTLIYEICSDSRIPHLWDLVQERLRPFAEQVHVWMHTAEMNRWEVANQRPIAGPQAVETTELLRKSLRDKRVLTNNKIHDIVAKTHQEREVNTIEKLSLASRSFGRFIKEQQDRNGSSSADDRNIGTLILRQLDDTDLIRLLAVNSYGDSANAGSYIPQARDITSEWIIFQSLRVNLAIIGLYIQKYGLVEQHGKKFPNTKLDADYLAALYYADALASDETTGDMFKLLDALYPSKKRITSAGLLAANLTEEEIRLRAYCRWQAGGCHGNALSDWLASESDMIHEFWRNQ
jgi:hypothetical protein